MVLEIRTKDLSPKAKDIGNQSQQRSCTEKIGELKNSMMKVPFKSVSKKTPIKKVLTQNLCKILLI